MNHAQNINVKFYTIQKFFFYNNVIHTLVLVETVKTKLVEYDFASSVLQFETFIKPCPWHSPHIPAGPSFFPHTGCDFFF